MMKESYEHPDTKEIMDAFKTNSYDVKISQGRIKYHLVKNQRMFNSYKRALRNLEKFDGIFELMNKEYIFEKNFESINEGLLLLEKFDEELNKIIDCGMTRYEEIEKSIIDNKDILSNKFKLEDDLGLS